MERAMVKSHFCSKPPKAHLLPLSYLRQFLLATRHRIQGDSTLIPDLTISINNRPDSAHVQPGHMV